MCLVLLLHIRANLGMMLARDYASCHVARNTLHVLMLVANNVHKLRWPAKNLDLNPTDHWSIESQGSCTATATKSQRAHVCYSSGGHLIKLRTNFLRKKFIWTYFLRKNMSFVHNSYDRIFSVDTADVILPRSYQINLLTFWGWSIRRNSDRFNMKL